VGNGAELTSNMEPVTIRLNADSVCLELTLSGESTPKLRTISPIFFIPENGFGHLKGCGCF
jgi:hypothetical protein